MKRFLLIFFAAVATLLPNCTDYDADIDALNDRIDGLESSSSVVSTQILTVSEQITSINSSIAALQQSQTDLSSYITALQSTALSLQSQISTNAANITSLTTSLNNLDAEIDSVKSEILAELTAVQKELEDELSLIETTITILQEKDTAIEEQITTLQSYIDSEIKDTEDWVAATYTTLEKYNSLADEVAEIKVAIESLNTSLTDLETKLTEEYTKSIETAIETLDGEIATKLTALTSDITASYTTAISTAKSEIETAYKAAIESSIDALESSMKSWVNEQLTGYYTITEVEEMLSTLKSELETELETQVTYLESLNTTLSETLEEDIDANTTLITALRSDLTSLDSDVAEYAKTIASNSEDIATNAQSILDNADNISANTTLIEANEALIESNATVISALQEAVANNASDIATNATDIATNATAVATNATAIATNASLISANTTAISNNTEAIETNVADILQLQTDLATTKSDITDAYKSAIETAITTLDGEIAEDVAAEVSTINTRIDTEVETINTAITSLESRVSDLETEVSTIKSTLLGLASSLAELQEQINAIIDRIQSIVYVPEYSDGNATMCYTLAGGSTTLRYKISPASVAEDLVEVWDSALSVNAAYTLTRSTADSFVDLPIVSATAEDGILTLVASGENLSRDYSIGTASASICLNISDGNNDLSSEFVNMVTGWFDSNIDNKDDLILFRDCVNAGGGAKSITVTLTDNIDLDGETWSPIGSDSIPFSGTFNGGGYTISNLTIESSSNYQGLFGYVSGCAITNLLLADAKVSGGDYVGSLCGCITGGEISRCGVYGGSVEGSSYVGGVVGQIYSSTLTTCYNSSLVEGSSYVGGLAGCSYYYSTLTACYNTGLVSGSSSFGRIAGASTGTITNCYYISPTTYTYGTRLDSLSDLNEAISTLNSSAKSTYFTINSDGENLPSLFDEQVDYVELYQEDMAISSVDDLKLFRTYVNAGIGPKTATLTKDLDLSDESWTPIGTSSIPCTTIFDGGGHTISNLTISGNSSCQGLFGYVSGGSISNLILKDPQIAGSSYNYIGALCGYITAGKISAVGIDGGSVSGYSYVGGVAGGSYSSSVVTACYNTSSVVGSNSYIGGVVGYPDSSAVTACYNTGSVVGSSSANSIVGNSSSSTITACYSILGTDSRATIVKTLSDLNDAVSTMNDVAGDDYFSINGDGILPSLFDEQISYVDLYIESMTINSVDDLKLFRDYVADGLSPGTATLTKDLDLSGESWTPIGKFLYPCTTIFDGGGHTISNLTILGSGMYQGLFGYVSGGSISNLILKDPQIAGGSYNNVSALCGYITAGKISAVGIDGGSVSGSYQVGGVVGYAYFSAVTACYNTSYVEGSNNNIGGVVGYAYSSAVTACYNTGSVEGASNAGGVVGTTYNSATVTACYSILGTDSKATIVKTLSDLNDAISTMNEAAEDNYFSTNSDGILPSLFDEQISYVDLYQDDMVIASVDDLKLFRNCVNGGCTPTTATLTIDLDLSDENWTPIGNSSYPCTTIFDGGGHTISNLTISSASSDYQGLFGYVDGGSISNLILKEPYITIVDDYYCGYYGAVCGCITNGEISRCGVSGGSIGGWNVIGGVVGRAYYSTITACYNTASVEGNGYVGGVVGTSMNSTVTSCYNTGSVEGNSNFVGGVVGYFSSSIITSSYFIDQEGDDASYGIGSSTSTDDDYMKLSSVSELNAVVSEMNTASNTAMETSGVVYYTAGDPADTYLPSIMGEYIKYE